MTVCLLAFCTWSAAPNLNPYPYSHFPFQPNETDKLEQKSLVYQVQLYSPRFEVDVWGRWMCCCVAKVQFIPNLELNSNKIGFDSFKCFCLDKDLPQISGCFWAWIEVAWIKWIGWWWSSKVKTKIPLSFHLRLLISANDKSKSLFLGQRYRQN